MAVIRWLVRIVVVVATLLIVAIVAGYALGRQRLDRKVQRPLPAIAAATDTAAAARGLHIAEFACAGCHGVRGGEFPLSGSRFSLLADSTGRGLGDLYAPNLTPGGAVLAAGDGAIARAIREGVGHDGRPLVVMPAFPTMSDDDVRAVIAFLRSQPAVEHDTPPRGLGFLAYLIVGSGLFPASLQPRPIGSVPAVAEAADAAYGEYLVNLAACRDCHGRDLRGMRPGPVPGPPAGPDLVALADTVPFVGFDQALRGGISVSGRPLAATMPWAVYARLTDLESRAIYEHARSR